MIHYHTLNKIHIYTLLYTITLYYYTLGNTLLYTVLWRETSVWILWKLIDFIAESRKETIDEKASYILFSTKISSASHITRSRNKKEEIDKKASEKASHPS